MVRLAVMLVLCVCSLHAQPYNMNIRLKGGALISIPVKDVQKLTFSGRLSGLGSERMETIVRTFTLLQNFPNPFNPSTTIEYELPRPGEVQIRIFNVNGQLVRAFAPAYVSSGMHATSWDGRNASGDVVATGMYVYQVTFEHAMLTRKMLFMK
jgi:hypothetical protein